MLDDDAKQQHITDNRDLLEDQARAFYGGIIHGIDEEITLEFKFLGQG